MSESTVTNLIVTYNSRSEVPRLLWDLQGHAPGISTILIDNASVDATADMVQLTFPEVRLVRNLENLGYAKAVNRGFGLSTSEYVFLLNPDIRIPSPRVFEDLQRCLDRDPQIAAAAPLQFSGTGQNHQLGFTWSHWDLPAFELYLSHLARATRDSSDPIPVTFLNAGCLFIRKSAFHAVGEFNEKYFLYGEEPDFFLKLKRHGFGCRLLPGVEVVHSRERSLMSVPFHQRLRLKLQGLFNIVDALLTGWLRILWDRLAGRGRRLDTR